MLRRVSPIHIFPCVVLLIAGMGSTCNLSLIPAPPFEFHDARFSRFEFQLLKYSDDRPESCVADIGAVQRAVITRSGDEMTMELWVINEGDETVEACEDDYTSGGQCRVIRQQTLHVSTAARRSEIAALIDGIEAIDDDGSIVIGDCNVPCFRRVYIRDGVMFEGLQTCNELYPPPYIDAKSQLKLIMFFNEVLEPEAVPSVSQ